LVLSALQGPLPRDPFLLLCGRHRRFFSIGWSAGEFLRYGFVDDEKATPTPCRQTGSDVAVDAALTALRQPCQISDKEKAWRRLTAAPTTTSPGLSSGGCRVVIVEHLRETPAKSATKLCTSAIILMDLSQLAKFQPIIE
jgi:hypothetical protein